MNYKTRLHYLIDSVIIEGKADTFAKALYPDYDVPWIEPLSPEESERVVKFIMENKYSLDIDNISKLHLGSKKDGIPKWSNYKIGFQIMESFLSNNPDITVDEWTLLPADKIIEDSVIEK